MRRSNSSRPPKVRLRFSGTGSRRWRREKASSCEVSLAPRSPASRICVRRLRAFSRSPLSRSRSRKLEPVRMTVSRLLKSWAIPPLSWPMACIFCAWNSASRVCSSACCASVASVMSRVILANPSKVPVSPRIGSTTTWARNLVPSLRTRQPLFSKRPSRVAISSAQAGKPAAWSSGV
ncbi:hypothetical protein D3C75_987300 [compost metagenome]